jgi:hypothetical protein
MDPNSALLLLLLLLVLVQGPLRMRDNTRALYTLDPLQHALCIVNVC